MSACFSCLIIGVRPNPVMHRAYGRTHGASRDLFFLFCDKNVLSLKNGPYSSATCDSGHGIRILQNCILNAAKSLSVGSPVTALPGLRVIPGIGWEERGRNRGNRNGGSSSA